jgi:hypothetical protein
MVYLLCYALILFQPVLSRDSETALPCPVGPGSIDLREMLSLPQTIGFDVTPFTTGTRQNNKQNAADQ